MAQPAIQTGRHAARQIQRRVAGQPTTAFRYHDKGNMATIGRRCAVVELPHGMRPRHAGLAGLAGAAPVTLLGGRNRLSALVNLSCRYLIWGHGGGVIVGDYPPAVLGEAGASPAHAGRVSAQPAHPGLLTMNHAPSQRD